MYAEDFSNVKFKGTFRDYQQVVLDNTTHHLDDRKIHIVAAPGSGKTILGLELMRRLGKPTLVLSPTVTIRQQWGDRFEERFLPENASLSSYLSFDLKEPRIITSVTYQALHSAASHSVHQESTDVGTDEKNDEQGHSINSDSTDTFSEIEDFSDFDLIDRMKQASIQVLCLDEAHHLRSEWYKALISFIKAMDDDLIVISLTATPPYDSSVSEWKRYEALCGPIDEEIFVPELVSKKTLCPHQDYLAFSYPTTSEKTALKKYRRKTEECLSEIRELHLLEQALREAGIFAEVKDKLDCILKHEQDFFTLFRMADRFGVKLPTEAKRMIKLRSRYKKATSWRKSWKEFESALQFILDNPEIFSEEVSEQLRYTLAKHGVMERRKVRLLSDQKITRMLVSSMGKLNALSHVVVTETASLGMSLRMLILTDYIKKDMTNIIGTETPITTMGAVPIFETVRRTVGEASSIALLSGSLVIIPVRIRDNIAEIASSKSMPCSFKPISNTPYLEVCFGGSNKNKVAVMTEAFQNGSIHILIGTKSLLGEGWDSPCINTLILATFVGSFMLSNQMRGRAIRTDPKNPDKTANIWHLVTIEPVMDSDDSPIAKLIYSGMEKTRELDGNDWETMVRRFDCFMGPAYSRPAIESGVERIDILKPPFNEPGIERINQHMESRAKDRRGVAQAWHDAVPAGFYPVVEATTSLPDVRLPLSFTLRNMLPLLALVVIEFIAGTALTGLRLETNGTGESTLAIAIMVVMLVLLIPLSRAALHVAHTISPKRTLTSVAESVLASLRQAGHIKSLGAKIRVSADPSDSLITFSIRQASVHEQNVFAQAIQEMISPLENPKYLLIRRQVKTYQYWHSYAVPTVLSAKKEDAELLRQNLSYLCGRFDLIYTYNAAGREKLWKSCCRSYVNLNTEILKKLTTL